MGFGAVGIVMLFVVFIFYMRMVDARSSNRRSKSQIESILEKAAVFESVDDDENALAEIEKALEKYPENPALLSKASVLKNRLNTSND